MQVAHAAPSIPNIGIKVYNKIRLITATKINPTAPTVNLSEVKIMAELEPVIKLNNADKLNIATTGTPFKNSDGRN